MVKRLLDSHALGLAVSAYTIWAVSDVFIKLSTDYHVPPYMIMAICGFYSSLMVLVYAVSQKRLKKLVPKNPKLVLLRGFIGALIGFLNYMAFARLPLANFYIVAFSAPLFVALGGRLFLHEKVSVRKALIILLGFIGVVIAVDPVALVQGKVDPWGYIFVLAGAIMFAGIQLILRHLSSKESTDTLIFASTAAQFIVGAIASALFFSPIDWHPYAYLFVTAFFGLCGQVLMIRAMQKAAAATVASVHYTQLIPAAIFGYLIWGNVPSLYLVAGSAVIVTSGLAMAHHEKQKRCKALEVLPT